jgi:hypothetical protein
MDDTLGNMLTVELLALSDWQTEQMSGRFRADPAGFYQGVIALLTEPLPEKE